MLESKLANVCRGAIVVITIFKISSYFLTLTSFLQLFFFNFTFISELNHVVLHFLFGKILSINDLQKGPYPKVNSYLKRLNGPIVNNTNQLCIIK